MGTAIVQQNSMPMSVEIERVLMMGDLSKLTPDQRLSYYNATCKSLGLNPLTRPFDYIALNGKLTLYAKRDCTDQLRKIHKVSIREVRAQKVDDLYVVVCSAEDADGRTDQSTGAVNITNIKGEALANAMMKAETKAKRRVTLSICGLGMLDETEVDTLRQTGEAEDYNQDQPTGRTPVSQPKRASEKQLTEAPKVDPVKTETQEPAKPKGDGTEVLGGVIQPPLKTGKENSQWMHLMTENGAKLIVVPQDKVDDDMKPGAYLTVKAVKKTSGKVGEFYEVQGVLENPPEAKQYVQEEEVIDAEFEEVENLDAEPPEETPTIEGLKSAGMVTTASKLPTGKVIGLSRAKHIRITASINNKQKGTGFTDDVIAELLKTLDPPLEHLRDLPESLEPEMLKYANGESDGWKKIVGGV